MELNIKLNDLTMSKEQVETFAYNIYRDIGTYIEENEDSFLEFILMRTVEKAEKYVFTIDGKIYLKERYKYKLTQYNEGDYNECSNLC